MPIAQELSSPLHFVCRVSKTFPPFSSMANGHGDAPGSQDLRIFFSYSLKAALNGVGAGTFHPWHFHSADRSRNSLPFAYACWCSGLERLVGAYILENNFTILRCLVTA